MAGKQSFKKGKLHTKIPRGATAPCWKLAIIDPTDEDIALCQVKNCEKPQIARGGKNGAKYSTSNITYHMENRHPVEFGPHKQAADERKTMQKLQQECLVIFWNSQGKIQIRAATVPLCPHQHLLEKV